MILTIEEMWARLAQHQPFADRRGYGPEWAKMCAERTETAAGTAQRMAVAAADAARARATRAGEIAAREAAAAAWAAADAVVALDEAFRWISRSEEQK